MRCNKHKNYKGLRSPKNQCPGCIKLYNEVTKASSKYYSITTPNFYCNLIHVITECMTIMLYGKQPAFFWRKGTVADFKAKKFFKKTYSGLKSQEKSNPTRIEALRSLFGIFVYSEKRRIESQKILDRCFLLETIEGDSEYSKIKPDENVIDQFLTEEQEEHSPSRWEILRRMEKENGTEKEEGKDDNS